MILGTFADLSQYFGFKEIWGAFSIDSTWLWLWQYLAGHPLGFGVEPDVNRCLMLAGCHWVHVKVIWDG